LAFITEMILDLILPGTGRRRESSQFKKVWKKRTHPAGQGTFMAHLSEDADWWIPASPLGRINSQFHRLHCPILSGGHCANGQRKYSCSTLCPCNGWLTISGQL